ncbi:hypothetical protein D915_003547 [Fasciola hepatica]|uniref:SEC7 domain-containing protein n=1 Tax=Fasciola hepatica TaxID=6192 RepID=A0A4E0RUP7_FASHE|nr:hypothetical protein D915_003547 [Fasciola hepatica]
MEKEPDTGFLKALSTLKTAASQAERNDLCYLLEESYALMKRWNCSQLRLWVLRDKVFEPIQLAVESNDSKLFAPAIHCLQAFLHDDRFKSCTEFASDPRWIPTQVLHTLCACSSFGENGQIEVQKILLDIGLSSQWLLGVNLLIKLVDLCLQMADSFDALCEVTLPRTVTSTLNQILESVVLNYARCEPETFDSLVRETAHKCCSPFSTEGSFPSGDALMRESDSESRVKRDEADVLRHDLLNVLDHLVRCLSLSVPMEERFNLKTVPYKSGRVQTVLSAILTILTHLPTGIVRFRAFTDLVWQSLCPTLISLMQANLADGSPSKKFTGTMTSLEFGRGSGVDHLNCPFPTEIAQIVYGIAFRLAHLLGPLMEMRPVLESLFHSILLYPPPRQRFAVLNTIKPLLSSETELLHITLPCWHLVNPTGESSQCTHELVPVSDWVVPEAHTGAVPIPFRLLRIVLDSLAECSCSGDGMLAQTSMDCMSALFGTLEHLSTGSQLTDWLIACLVPQITQLTKDSAVEVDDSPSASVYLSQHSDYATSSLHSNNTHESIAREFIDALRAALPVWFRCSSMDELDRSLREFSSHFCQTVCDRFRSGEDTVSENSGQHTTIFNADAIYVMSYSALALNWRLWLHGYYEQDRKSWKLTDEDEQCFIDSILNRNLLVYLPVSFIKEVYRSVTHENYLRQAELDLNTIRAGHVSPQHRLSSNPAHLLTECELCALLNAFNGVQEDLQDRRDHRAFLFEQSPALVGSRLVRFLLGSIWSPLLWSVAGTFCIPGLFGLRSHLQIVQLGHLAQLELHTPSHWTRLLPQSGDAVNRVATGQAILATVRLIRLSIQLAAQCKRHREVAQLLELLVHVVWASLGAVGDSWDSSTAVRTDNPSVVTNGTGVGGIFSTGKRPSVHTVHILLLDTVLRCVADCGVRSEKGWWMVFRACRLISGLEHRLFSSICGTHVPARPTEQPTGDKDDASQFLLRLLESNEISMGYSSVYTDNLDTTTSKTVNNSHEHPLVGSSGFLNNGTAEHLLGMLHRATDRLFQQAAVNHFSMPELILFTRALLSASREITFTSDPNLISAGATGPSLFALDPFGVNPMLDRLCQLLLDLVRGTNRPLIHLLYVWATVADDLIKVCHIHGWFTGGQTNPVSQPLLAQRVLDAMYTCILTLITTYSELPRFTTNEAWCKPLENTIKLELCDSDVQDRLITCLCALIESGSDYLRSAWKPLFSALRCVRPECVRLSSQSASCPRARLSDQFGIFQRVKHALFKSVHACRHADSQAERMRGKDGGDSDLRTPFLNSPRPALELSARRLGTVVEIFEVFLSTVNEEVFCDTAVDFLLCLLHMLTVFRHSTDGVASSNSDPVGLSPPAIQPFWAMFDESTACPTDSRNLYPDDFNALLFRTGSSIDDKAAVAPNALGDTLSPETTSTTTVFLAILTCLMRSIYSLERLWTMPRVPSIRQARYQFHLRCALDQEHLDADDQQILQSPGSHPLMLVLDSLDQGTGVLFAYCLIVHQLISIIWTSDRVQRGLLLDTVLRLIRGASLGFPTEPPKLSLDRPPGSLTVHLTNHLLLPIARRWVDIYTWSFDRLKTNYIPAKPNEFIVVSPDSGNSCEQNETTQRTVTLGTGKERLTETVGEYATTDKLSESITCCYVCMKRDNDLRFLRVSLGQLTELVMESVNLGSSVEDIGVFISFTQLLALLHQVSAFTTDSLCYLGSTCLRHILLTHTNSLPDSYLSELMTVFFKQFQSDETVIDDLPNEDNVKGAAPVEGEHACRVCDDDTQCLLPVLLQLWAYCPPSDRIVVDRIPDSVVDDAFAKHDTHRACPAIRSLIRRELLVQTIVDLFVWRSPSELLPIQTTEQSETQRSNVLVGDGSESNAADRRPLFGMFDHHPTSNISTAHLERLSCVQLVQLNQCLEQWYSFCLAVYQNGPTRQRMRDLLGLDFPPGLIGHASKTVVIALRILAYLILKHRVTFSSSSFTVEHVLPASKRMTITEFLERTASIDLPNSCSHNTDWSVLGTLFMHWFTRSICGATVTQPEVAFETLQNNPTSDSVQNNVDGTNHPKECANGLTDFIALSAELSDHIPSYFIEDLSEFLRWLDQLVQYFGDINTASEERPSLNVPNANPISLDVWCDLALLSQKEIFLQNPIYKSVRQILTKNHLFEKDQVAE